MSTSVSGVADPPAGPRALRLEEHPFFHGLNAENVQAVVAATKVCNYQPNEVVFEEGSASEALYLVLEGRVAFEKSMPDQTWRAISYSHPGDFFGEIGVLTGAPRALRAIATGPTRLGRVPNEVLRELIRRTPGPIDQIMQSILNHLHHTTHHYVQDMVHQEKMALVGNMVSSIIHDFKNPFTLISLAAQLVQQMHDDERTKKLCANMVKQIHRMVDMANEISEFSKGVQVLRPTRVDLRELVKKFRELNEPYFQKEHVRIETHIDHVVIEAEENKLLRVLQNLVSNAIDACNERRHGLVRIAVHDRGAQVELTIADNGPGIPEAIRLNLFDPFVTHGKSGGTGLGTAIVKSIVEAHKGHIRFETATGEGTTFFITLPKTQTLRG